ncbi:hypothetical protein [Vreelandella subglaciescola]|uniref:Uncharacterized protein n=1 Tax=Vreelandella subglaciescola TaxID=29571 RepID=A0A1M7HRD3_9GAMM|nr:hypothetical protein [Halomonas subglaciescola]SHM31045.1 hypothetical protein SAMN05878437_2298 [Halomonas subglaciescola]
MNKAGLLLLVCLFFSFNAFADFIHPMDFDGSEAQKNRVIKIVKARVKKDYCDSGLDMCQSTTLRMMEGENLTAFKNASQAKNRKIMDRVIKDYCNSGLDMCSYTNIFMMYQENLKASKSSLSW